MNLWKSYLGINFGLAEFKKLTEIGKTRANALEKNIWLIQF